MPEHMWPGANHGHIANDHIKELGQLIDIRFTQESTQPGDPVIILCHLFCICFPVDPEGRN